MARRARVLSKGPLWASVVTHVVILAALWGLSVLKPAPILYEVVQIQISSPPPARSEAPAPVEAPPAIEEELVVETPDEVPPVIEDEAPEVAPDEPEPDPEPVVTPPQDTPPPVDTPSAEEPAESDPSPTESPEAGETTEDASDSGADLNVRMEGLRRDYPTYYGNIISQIGRCFRTEHKGNLEVTVSFVIQSDGKTVDFGIAKKSGNFGFDLDAMSAVECAGRPGAIGPLPEGFPWEILPIEFTLTPRGR